MSEVAQMATKRSHDIALQQKAEQLETSGTEQMPHDFADNALCHAAMKPRWMLTEQQSKGNANKQVPKQKSLHLPSGAAILA